ncbi:hypothetical protein DIE00_27435 [Burkholderia sp. Bp8989]|nr:MULTISPECIES: ATP-binding protein [unclassified Burkholderia]RQS32014.1 hypothetical protein DIE05_07960 [Burkholderia sp. Bp8995]RQS41919.1 hypothetical protein DIE00_27435 [Burkholderia sp. Bp8989]
MSWGACHGVWQEPTSYIRRAIVLTSNVPFTQRATAFADDQALTAATLGQLLHHGHIVRISGMDSNRSKSPSTRRDDVEA